MQNKIKILPLVTMLALAACAAQPQPSVAQSNPQWKNLEIQCVHEKRPAISPETKQLYDYALYQDLHNMWSGKKGDVIWQSTLPYYRIAAANGDYKANIRLQYLLKTQRIKTDNNINEVLALNEMLSLQLPATAYYNTYLYLQLGYGIKTKEKLGRFAFLRKAAEMGSREAQFELGNLILSIKDGNSFNDRMKIWEVLLSCSSNQGFSEAGESLGILYQDDKKYLKAIKYYHQGVKNGSSVAGNMLSDGFRGEYPKDHYGYLGDFRDLERAKRYEMIADFLFSHDYLFPTVPDLDEIVPLPPAKLPPWDGKIAFQRWFEGPSPEKPSDELMQKLAKQAGLDWQTGLPLKK
ncbi:sel1 repeat family protein [Haemophilus haemoglobinophilus]|nr:sel1 repeat family protein [Canicola haemoglobinophilus]MBN6712210.1 sel1 repeat family protein [Canicola haemoglobinophilus]